ncbi:hypothetical protein [Paraburkholderia caribensis]|nr:hypothetical protein [Paraburkholderia caribensis]
MDIPIGTWCAFVLCTTHNAQSKNAAQLEKNSARNWGFPRPKMVRAWG